MHGHAINPISHSSELWLIRFFFLNLSKFKYYLIKYKSCYVYLLIWMFVWLFVVVNLRTNSREAFRTTRHVMVSTLARTKASLTEPFDHTAPIYMVVASRVWLVWLLHYYLHCSLIDVSCLTQILFYALTWVFTCYMIFTWLLNAWVIWLMMEYSDDGYGW
jgi:hypothetical protein